MEGSEQRQTDIEEKIEHDIKFLQAQKLSVNLKTEEEEETTRGCSLSGETQTLLAFTVQYFRLTTVTLQLKLF